MSCEQLRKELIADNKLALSEAPSSIDYSLPESSWTSESTNPLVPVVSFSFSLSHPSDFFKNSNRQTSLQWRRPLQHSFFSVRIRVGCTILPHHNTLAIAGPLIIKAAASDQTFSCELRELLSALAFTYTHKHHKNVYIGKAVSEFSHLSTLVFSFVVFFSSFSSHVAC